MTRQHLIKQKQNSCKYIKSNKKPKIDFINWLFAKYMRYWFRILLKTGLTVYRYLIKNRFVVQVYVSKARKQACLFNSANNARVKGPRGRSETSFHLTLRILALKCNFIQTVVDSIQQTRLKSFD